MKNETYIRILAGRIRSKVDASKLPAADIEELFDSYAVLALAKKDKISNEDVHNAWAAWATRHDPSSLELVPYEQLLKTVQDQDTMFTSAINAVVHEDYLT